MMGGFEQDVKSMDTQYEKFLEIVWPKLRADYQRILDESSLDGLEEARAKEWCKALNVSASELYDLIAEKLARDFHASKIDFDLCDTIVNDVYALIMHTKGRLPDLFNSVYKAFDEGEYDHGGANDEDPIEAYTQPMIAKIVKSL